MATVLSISLLFAIAAQDSPAANSAIATPNDTKPTVDDFINRQIEAFTKKKMMKKLPRTIEKEFPFRIQQRTDLSPEEHQKWVERSPNRVKFGGRLPEKLDEEFHLKLMKRRAVGSRRYQFDLRITFPLRDIHIRLDIPPGGFVFDHMDTDFHIDTRIDFEWDYLGAKDERKALFGLINVRDIGIFPGGTSEFLASSNKLPQPELIKTLDLQADLGLSKLRIAGTRGKLMYANGRFVGRRPLWRLIAGATNFGFDIAKVAKQEDNLLERIVEEAINRSMYENQPKIVALANDEFFDEEVGPNGLKVNPFDVLREAFPKQTMPSVLPGTAN